MEKLPLPAHGKTRAIARSLGRVALALLLIFAVTAVAYLFWNPGLKITDGRHDKGTNGIWLAHGWLGDDTWFTTNNKTAEFPKYRSPEAIAALFRKLRAHHITDVFPHLCPASPAGHIPAVHSAQVERFLDSAEGLRVIPWIGGPNGTSALISDKTWRDTFTKDAASLLAAHPRLAGVQINIEPLRSGDPDFLLLLENLRAALPPGKLLSVAAYPPPTLWHPFPDVHWDEPYFRQVARRCDQLAVMMYDAGQRLPKTYQRLMADWTREILAWSEGKAILLGVPTYADQGVGYHHPEVENIHNALPGIHRALNTSPPPHNYQGIAIYCDWETDDHEWSLLKQNFLRTK
ncbi:MAG: hypothetical protein RL088_2894 [Verrucomicrobiota bacterium]|jgi:hypothetical protein